MRCCRPIFVIDEMIGPTFRERQRIACSIHAARNSCFLAPSRRDAVSFEIRKIVDRAFGDESAHDSFHVRLQRCSAGDYDSDADRAFGMKSLEILEVAV